MAAKLLLRTTSRVDANQPAVVKALQAISALLLTLTLLHLQSLAELLRAAE
jgi:hypothetical protein